MADERTYYAPQADNTSLFHALADPSDIRGLCGEMIDNSGDNLRDRRPPKNVCPKCDRILNDDKGDDSGSD